MPKQGSHGRLSYSGPPVQAEFPGTADRRSRCSALAAAGLAEQPLPQVHAVGTGRRCPGLARLRQRVLRDNDVHAFLLRMAGQQMTWQVPEYETIARTAAIFEQTPPLQPMGCLRPGWDTELFGCTIREYVGTAQLAWAARSAAQDDSTRLCSTLRTAS